MRVLALLDNPFVWKASRFGLDLVFGLYRKRVQTMQRWGVLENHPSLLDVGCGIGQYARITDGSYLGIDLNQRHIDFAKKHKTGDNKTFRCENATRLLEERSRFDVVLLVDFLHHVTDEQAIDVLAVAGRLARKYVVSFEPLLAQTNAIARWIVAHDQGKYVRPLDPLHQLFEAAGLPIAESFPLRLGLLNTRAILCDLRSRQQLPAAA